MRFNTYNVHTINSTDIDPVCVSRIKDNVTKAIVADVTDREQLLELDINTFDVAVVAISKHFEEAVTCTLLLKELNVPYVIAKARTKRKKIILEKVGADRVINTEKEMAYKLAKHLLRRSIVDLVELDEEYSIIEKGIAFCYSLVRKSHFSTSFVLLTTRK